MTFQLSDNFICQKRRKINVIFGESTDTLSFIPLSLYIISSAHIIHIVINVTTFGSIETVRIFLSKEFCF